VNGPAGEDRDRLKRLDGQVLHRLTHQAADSPRKRGHYNLHPVLDDPVQRLCLAAEPESYFRPHRHSSRGKWELFLALRGAAAVLTFDARGTVVERVEIAAGGETPAVEIPPGAWHALAVLEQSTLLFEVKPGPYVPATDKDFASWSPEEDSPGRSAVTAWLRTARAGDLLPR
jgi:cupin fold WbuC family metalloprotein